MPEPHGCIAGDDDGPSGEELAAALDLIGIATRRGLLCLDYGGRIATAFLPRERGWDRVHARHLLDRPVADGWLVSPRRGQPQPWDRFAQLTSLERQIHRGAVKLPREFTRLNFGASIVVSLVEFRA